MKLPAHYKERELQTPKTTFLTRKKIFRIADRATSHRTRFANAKISTFSPTKRRQRAIVAHSRMGEVFTRKFHNRTEEGAFVTSSIRKTSLEVSACCRVRISPVTHLPAAATAHTVTQAHCQPCSPPFHNQQPHFPDCLPLPPCGHLPSVSK